MARGNFLLYLLDVSDQPTALAVPFWLCILIGAGMTAALAVAITWARFLPLQLTPFVSVSLYLMLAPVRGDQISHEVLVAMMALVPLLMFVVLLVQQSLADPAFSVESSWKWTLTSALLPGILAFSLQALAVPRFRAS